VRALLPCLPGDCCCPGRAAHQAAFLQGCSARLLPCTRPPAVRKAKASREAVRFSWLHDRPLQLQYNEMPTARARGMARS
jgi:hypothetical protein